MWNRDLNLFLSPLQHEPWEKTDRTLERRPSPLTFFFFKVIESSPELRWVKSFSSSIREHLTCNTFCFCLIFFLLDNTLKGGDRVRGGFSSQNIPTPLKTIRFTITFILPFSNDYGNFVCKVTYWPLLRIVLTVLQEMCFLYVHTSNIVGNNWRCTCYIFVGY